MATKTSAHLHSLRPTPTTAPTLMAHYNRMEAEKNLNGTALPGSCAIDRPSVNYERLERRRVFLQPTHPTWHPRLNALLSYFVFILS